MSDHYEVVFACFLREDTPQGILDALRWHLGLSQEQPDLPDPDAHLEQRLSPDPNTSLPGGDVAELRLQDEGWGLSARNYWLDDDIGWVFSLIELIAPHVAVRGYGGFFREVGEVAPTVFAFTDGGFGLTRRWGGLPMWQE